MPRFFGEHLNDLKQDSEVELTPEAGQVSIHKTPLKPLVEVDFDPDEGVEVRTQFQSESLESPIKPSEIDWLSDGSFGRLGNHFFPRPSGINQDIEAILENDLIKIPPSGVPQFFKRDLVLLRSNLNAVVTPNAEKVKVLNQPMVPSVKIELSSPGWLEFRVEYEEDGESISLTELEGNSDPFI
ncbi:MAG: hypothetical protein KC964_17155, partial [Candidatus Omnitrophica bacterium]|nr:hypothetical protein [Candidatus Omnitrophota bacterium]